MSFHVFLITAIVGVSMIAALTVFLQRHGWWSTTSTLVIVSSCLVGAALIAGATAGGVHTLLVKGHYTRDRDGIRVLKHAQPKLRR